jgi:hypothetical protein
MLKKTEYTLLTNSTIQDSFYTSLKDSEEMKSHVEFGVVESLPENFKSIGETEKSLDTLKEELKILESEYEKVYNDYKNQAAYVASLTEQLPPPPEITEAESRLGELAQEVLSSATEREKKKNEISQKEDELAGLIGEQIVKKQRVTFRQDSFSNRAWDQFSIDFLTTWGDISSKSKSVSRRELTRNIPDVKREFSVNINNGSLSNEVVQKFNTNYLKLNYENVISDEQVRETSLPNFYQELENSSGQLSQSFFDDYDPFAIQNPETNRNMLISYENYEALKKYNGKQDEFPLVSIVSPANGIFDGQKSVISKALKDANMDLLAMNTAVALTQYDPQALSDRRFDFFVNQEYFQTGSSEVSGTINLPTIDLLQWASAAKDVSAALANIDEGDKTYLGKGDIKSKKISNYSAASIKFLLSSEQIQANLQDILNNNILSFKEMINGKENYSEVIFYQIDKYVGDPSNGEPVQTFWLPNYSDLSPLEYVDTQVKYNVGYTYVVTAFVGVVSTKYYYSSPSSKVFISTPSTNTKNSQFQIDNVQTFSVNNPQIQIDVISYPTLEMLPVKLFQYSGTVLDSPPLMPHVNIAPYIGRDNRILLQMNAKIGEYTNVPVVLDSEDQAYIDELINTFGYQQGDPIVYKSDDEIGSFQIYRSDEMPTSYNSFEGREHALISTNNGATLSWSADVVDRIEPNRPYYYMFRSIDQHGHKSYPSEIYKLTLVNDAGAIFPIIENVDIINGEEQQKPEPKKLQKLLQIAPTYNQLSIDYTNLFQDGLLVNGVTQFQKQIQLGTLSDKIWNKTYKIRVTSKHTGKKIDLNVTFKVENE